MARASRMAWAGQRDHSVPPRGGTERLAASMLGIAIVGSYFRGSVSCAAAHVATLPRPSQPAFQQSRQISGIEGLGEVVVEAFGDVARAILGKRIGSQRDDRRTG